MTPPALTAASVAQVGSWDSVELRPAEVLTSAFASVLAAIDDVVETDLASLPETAQSFKVEVDATTHALVTFPFEVFGADAGFCGNSGLMPAGCGLDGCCRCRHSWPRRIELWAMRVGC